MYACGTFQGDNRLPLKVRLYERISAELCRRRHLLADGQNMEIGTPNECALQVWARCLQPDHVGLDQLVMRHWR